MLPYPYVDICEYIYLGLKKLMSHEQGECQKFKAKFGPKMSIN